MHYNEAMFFYPARFQANNAEEWRGRWQLAGRSWERMGGKGEREGGTRNAAAAGCYIVLLTAAAFPFIRLAAARHLLPPGQIAPGGGFIF